VVLDDIQSPADDPACWEALAQERIRSGTLEAEHRFLRDAWDASGEAMMITAADRGPPSRRILDVNPAFGALTGYSRDEVLGQSPRMLWGPSADPQVVAELRLRLGREEDFLGETWMRRLDGTEVLVSQRVTPVRGGDGQVRHFVTVMRDMTRERAAQEALLAARAEANLARGMETLGRFASGIVHDFNNVLAALLANLELLAEGPLSAAQQECVDDVRGAADRGTALTRALLMFCRREIAHPQDLDVDAACREALRLLRRVLGDGVRTEAHLDAQGARARLDASGFGQLLMNLCLNARDAMPQGGILSLRSWADRDRVSLEVQDAGVGMTAAVQALALQGDFTTKGPGRGAGLGLSTVRAVVAAGGGELSVTSRPGEGTRVRVSFPRVWSRVAAVTPPRALAGQSLPGRPARVLLVEDDDALRESLHRVLLRAGHEVLTARSPGDALLLAELQPRPFDVVLSDVEMPLIDGPALVARLRQRQPGLPAVFMSAHVAPETIAAADGPLLAKPFDDDALHAALAARLSRDP
jgi:two-component system cell cycle sensor histidine kinase/response regulator CckA